MAALRAAEALLLEVDGRIAAALALPLSMPLAIAASSGASGGASRRRVAPR